MNRLILGWLTAALLFCASPANGESPKKENQQAVSQEKLPDLLRQYVSQRYGAAPAPVASMPREQMAGEIFGQPVSKDNYYFAKRVAMMFPLPWGAAELPPEKQEAQVWENLILHYESFRRGMEATEEEINATVDEILKSQKQSISRRSDPEAYRKWVEDTLQEKVELFENQVRYIIQIKKLKEKIRNEAKVTVVEEELHQEFLNEKNHVGGEMVTFPTREEAQQFYEKFKDPKRWEKMKTKKEVNVRPVSLMTLEAYMDLWGIPKDQMVAFHALEIGSVGPPLPFGTKEWAVYRLLEKRTGDLKDFPKERESYRNQVEMKKKYEALNRWIEQLKASANLKTF